MATDREQDRELIEGTDAFGTKLGELIAGTSATLFVLSLRLDRKWYAREDVVDALKQFALRSERSNARVLVADARGATSNSNPFLDLARRLPSRVQMRELTPEKREQDGPEIIIADRTRMLELGDQRRLSASFYPSASPRMLEKMKDLDAYWDESEPVLELSGMKF
jgi:hypothetical protein